MSRRERAGHLRHEVWYGKAFTSAKDMACEIRKRTPGIVLVAGGYHATLYEEDFLKNSLFDLAVLSEGETALTKILDVVVEGRTGECYKRNKDSRERLLAAIRKEIRQGLLKNVVYRDGQTIRKTAKIRDAINAKHIPGISETGMVVCHRSADRMIEWACPGNRAGT